MREACFSGRQAGRGAAAAQGPTPRGRGEVRCAVPCLQLPGPDTEAAAPPSGALPGQPQQHNNNTMTPVDTTHGQGSQVPETGAGGALPRGGDGKQEEEA